MHVKAIWARNSAVTSTTVDAVAVCHATPCNVTARAPNTNPPTWENGRQLAEASRTMRPQISTQGRRMVLAGVITSQARPRITNSTICHPSITPNFGQPIRLDCGDDIAEPIIGHQQQRDEEAQERQNIRQAFHEGRLLPAPRPRGKPASVSGDGTLVYRGEPKIRSARSCLCSIA